MDSGFAERDARFWVHPKRTEMIRSYIVALKGGSDSGEDWQVRPCLLALKPDGDALQLLYSRVHYSAVPVNLLCALFAHARAKSSWRMLICLGIITEPWTVLIKRGTQSPIRHGNGKNTPCIYILWAEEPIISVMFFSTPSYFIGRTLILFRALLCPSNSGWLVGKVSKLKRSLGWIDDWLVGSAVRGHIKATDTLSTSMLPDLRAHFYIFALL